MIDIGAFLDILQGMVKPEMLDIKSFENSLNVLASHPILKECLPVISEPETPAAKRNAALSWLKILIKNIHERQLQIQAGKFADLREKIQEANEALKEAKRQALACQERLEQVWELFDEEQQALEEAEEAQKQEQEKQEKQKAELVEHHLREYTAAILVAQEVVITHFKQPEHMQALLGGELAQEHLDEFFEMLKALLDFENQELFEADVARKNAVLVKDHKPQMATSTPAFHTYRKSAADLSDFADRVQKNLTLHHQVHSALQKVKVSDTVDHPDQQYADFLKRFKTDHKLLAFKEACYHAQGVHGAFVSAQDLLHVQGPSSSRPSLSP